MSMFNEEVAGHIKNQKVLKYENYMSSVLTEEFKRRDEKIKKKIKTHDVRYLVHEDNTALSLDEIYFRVRDLVDDEKICGTRNYRFTRIFTDSLVESIFYKFRKYRATHGADPNDQDWKDKILRPLPEIQEVLFYLEHVGV